VRSDRGPAGTKRALGRRNSRCKGSEARAGWYIGGSARRPGRLQKSEEEELGVGREEGDQTTWTLWATEGSSVFNRK
jgi:hypothetical protein